MNLGMSVSSIGHARIARYFRAEKRVVSGADSAGPYRPNEVLTADSSIELAARGARIWLARLRHFRTLGEKSALFAAADTLVRPQSFENEFAGAATSRRAIFSARRRAINVFEQALNFAQLAHKIIREELCRKLSVRRPFQTT